MISFYRIIFLLLIFVSTAQPGRLHDAVRQGDLQEVDRLIELGEDINDRDENSRTPLHRAAEKGHIAIAKLLLDRGAEIDAKTEYSRSTSLHFAISNQRFEMVKLLMGYKADVNAQDHAGETPLHWAVDRGDLPIIEYLLDHGADVNKPTWTSKRTPLHVAAKLKYEKVALLLIQKHADVDAQDKDGETPLDLAEWLILYLGD